MLGEVYVKKLDPLSLFNNTIQRRITDMSSDIRSQITGEIKAAPLGLFSIQVDESTDVASCAQLMVFVRYIHNETFKEEFLFCQPLESRTRGIDVFQKANNYFEAEGLQ